MQREPDFVTLTYRQLADELGISVVAARTRVRRAVAAGRWRVVPGNRPSDPSYIQMPREDMAELQHGTRAANAQSSEARERSGSAIASAPRAGEELVIDTLRSAYRHIERLHNAALIEKDERRALELRLVAAERTNEHLQAEVAKLEDWVRQLDTQLTSEMDGKNQLVMQLADLKASERQSHQRGLELQFRIENLRRLLRDARRPLWRRIFYKPAA